MDARIGAPASGHMDALPDDERDGFLHGLLHRDLVGLPLPAVIGRAVVAEAKGDISHTAYLVRTMAPARMSTHSASAM